MRVLIFIVAYNAEKHIESVLQRLQQAHRSNADYTLDVLIIDDASKDNTSEIARAYLAESSLNISVLKNPRNLGYGGNQKLGYQYAIHYKYDAVVLLHGDGQYPPEYMEDMIRPLIENSADVVLGSRMQSWKSARAGGMPLYKLIGNIILTRMQNGLLGTELSEFHTGFRSYRVDFLQRVPFEYNSDDFDFDTDILIQAVNDQARIQEIAIPTHYGDEVCNVNGLKYAFQITRSTILSRIQKYYIYYHPKFAVQQHAGYEPKTDFDSSHTYAIRMVKEGSTVLDIGGSTGYVASKLRKEKNCTVYGVDMEEFSTTRESYDGFMQLDLDREDIAKAVKTEMDVFLLLDVIEHLSHPEAFITRLRQLTSDRPSSVVITTGNVGFFLVRISLAIGNFNYNKRGILDFTHKRLFTFSSLKRLLQQHGYDIEKMEGIPLPFELIFGDGWLGSTCARINRFFIRLWPAAFAYQIATIVRPKPTLDVLLSAANNKE